MALSKASDWKGNQRVTNQLYEILIYADLPGAMSDVLDNPAWMALWYVWLEGEISKENFDFLMAVDDLRHNQPDLERARAIYDTFVKDDATRLVNMSGDVRPPLLEAFKATPAPDRYEIFAASYNEVLLLTHSDTWRRFIETVGDVRKEVTSYEDETVPKPVEEPPAPKITPADADKWNDAALKALAEGQSTVYWELGEDPFLIVIEAKGKSNPPKYVTWAREYDIAQGTIVMTAKGSVFAKDGNRGKLTITGAGDEDGVTSAIRRFSKKEIVHS